MFFFLCRHNLPLSVFIIIFYAFILHYLITDYFIIRIYFYVVNFIILSTLKEKLFKVIIYNHLRGLQNYFEKLCKAAIYIYLVLLLFTCASVLSTNKWLCRSVRQSFVFLHNETRWRFHQHEVLRKTE